MKATAPEKTQPQPAPTPFELAQLALGVQAQMTLSNETGTFRPAVEYALKLWEESARVAQGRADAVQKLNIILGGVLTMQDSEWQARVADYLATGSREEFRRAMSAPRFERERVGKELFKDKTLTRQQRLNLMLGLPKRAIKNRMAPPPGQDDTFWRSYKPEDESITPEQAQSCGSAVCVNENREYFIPKNPAPLEMVLRDIDQALLSADLCRWLWSVRQSQLSEAKKRDVSPSFYRKNYTKKRRNLDAFEG